MRDIWKLCPRRKKKREEVAVWKEEWRIENTNIKWLIIPSIHCVVCGVCFRMKDSRLIIHSGAGSIWRQVKVLTASKKMDIIEK